MITNERQYRITKASLSKFQKAVETFDIDEGTNRIGSTVLAKAELEALRSEMAVLSTQLSEYEKLKSGAVTILKAENLDELPSILIRARIARGLSQRQLADKLKLKEQQIQRYESDQYASASLRRLAEVARALEMNISEVAELSQGLSEGISDESNEIDWTNFPVREMYRRGWFEGLFTGSAKAAMVEADSLVRAFVTRVVGRPTVALHRKRVRLGSNFDLYALIAWECRILTVAEKTPARGEYTHGSLDADWLKNLVSESRYSDGPIRAKKRLDKKGITLVTEPHLPHTYLDGAAFLHGDKPVIGLTLRYDRLDNFWFVLFHELIHIAKHLRKGEVEQIFDDMEAEPDELEREADTLAAEALIPNELWETSIARYVRSEESIDLLAEELKISPAIIAGRIRSEADDYMILNDMIGQGEVRKQFPEVD